MAEFFYHLISLSVCRNAAGVFWFWSTG